MKVTQLMKSNKKIYQKGQTKNLLSKPCTHIACTHIVLNLCFVFQTRGHNLADLDPLGILHADLDSRVPEELVLENYGFGKSNSPENVGTCYITLIIDCHQISLLTFNEFK